MLHGLGIRINLGGGWFNEGYWDEEGRHQYGQYFDSGACYVGEFKDGLRCGQGKYIDSYGKTEEGLFVKGSLVEGTRENRDGSTEKGKFEYDFQNKLIQGTRTDKNGNITQVVNPNRGRF